MLNDPELDKMIIYGLAGVCLVLLLAVIFLAVKRNVYYVDEEGREVPSPRKKARRAAKKAKTEAEPEIEEEPVYTEPVQPEEETVLPEEAELPEEPSFEEPAAEESFEEQVSEPEPIFEEPVADDIFLEPEPEGVETVVVPFMAEESGMPAAEPIELTTGESAPMRTISLEDDSEEYGEEPVLAEPAVKPTGLVVTVTVAGQSQTHEIDLLPCLIGREQSSCDLVISEPAVSRRHARIYAGDDSLYIEDVSEHNGTYINGTKLPSLGSAKINENDRISLGRAELTVVRILY